MAAAGVKPDLYFNADICKVEDLPDGSCVVYGIPCVPGVVDNDGQIVNADWLRAALSEWYSTGANVREMHQPSAVGVGTELDWKGDIPYLTARVVDPVAERKVRAGIYKAFSVGIKAPKTRTNRQAPKGEIVGGKIVELTLCDRPCVPGSDILDFKADLFKIASAVSDDEVLDHQQGVV